MTEIMTDAFFPIISLTLVVLLFTGIAVTRVQADTNAYRIAQTGSLLALLLVSFIFVSLDFGNPDLQFVEYAGSGLISWHVGIDSTNILFLALITLLTPMLLYYLRLTGANVNRRQLAGILCYEGVLLAAVSAQQLFLFWCLLLLEYIPLRILSSVGQIDKHAATGTVTRYWVLMLVLLMAGMLVLGLSEGNFSTLGLILLFFGFAVRLPVFPFHGWLPVLVTNANAVAVFCFIAGIKIGIYGVLRFTLPLVQDFSFWTGFIQVLGLVSIFYGALMALMQINLNRMLAFAIISQNGMMLIGLFTLNIHGQVGSILLSNAFGLAAVGMILGVGFVRSKTGTVLIPRLGNLFEKNVFPAMLFFLGALSTMAIPGTPGYHAAHLLLEGVIEENGWFTAIAILVGNVLAAAFLLRAFQQIFIADARRPAVVTDSTPPVLGEIVISCLICVLLLLAGFSPLAELLGVV